MKRLAVRLGIVPDGHRGRVLLAAPDVARLRERLGSRSRSATFTTSESALLAALARSPLGVVSARAAARKAGVSPTTAAKALRALVEAGAVTATHERVAMGRVRDATVYRLSLGSAAWPAIEDAIRGVTPPLAAHRAPATAVPRTLRHLFWNTDDRQLETRQHGDSIARRLIVAGDIDGLAWGRENLSAENWRHAARTRGISVRQRALALNIAEHRDAP